MKRFDVIALGVAVMDIIASPVDSSVFEREKTLADITLSAGGDAANQSVSLAKLGLNVSLCCRIGADSIGKLFLSAIGSGGIDTTHITISQSSVTSPAIVLVSQGGEKNIIYQKGNNYDLCIDDIDMDYIAGTRALSVGSIFGIPALEEKGLLEILINAKEKGVITFADMGSDKKGSGLGGVSPFLPYLDYFMPSEADSVGLTGYTDCREAAKVFIGEGANNVIIKLGSRGAYADCKDFKGFADGFRINAKDTTGAGDAFCAGFIFGILNGYTIRSSLEFACACGAFNSLYSGASTSPISLDKINGFIKNTSKNIVSRQ